MAKKTTSRLPIVLAVIAAASASAAWATCWEEAARTYNIPVNVLKAVAQTESNSRPGATHRNPDGTHDIGLMQINSAWLPSLAQFGIQANDLRDTCTNLKVGAWILARNAMRLGWNWDAIGAYNVGCARLSKKECDRRRSNYAWKIHSALKAVLETRVATQAAGSPLPNRAAKPIQIVWLDAAPAQPVPNGAARPQEYAKDAQGAGDED